MCRQSNKRIITQDEHYRPVQSAGKDIQLIDVAVTMTHDLSPGADQLEHATPILRLSVTAFLQTDLFLAYLLFSKIKAVPLQ